MVAPLPYLTADLPGTGGALRSVDDDFHVDEIPAYLPRGDGDHVFVHIEKRGLTTMTAVEALARACGVRARDVGYAGMKDRHAVTRQWLSLPPPCRPEQLAELAIPGLTVLTAARHGNKLRTGHLRGNRFALIVRGVDDPAAAAARARAILDRLATAPGAPNFYGEQRFGRAGDNAAQGRAVLRGERGRGRQDRVTRLLISAAQSELFNEWLRRRLDDGLYARVIAGDQLEKRASGGPFGTTEPEVDEARVATGEVVVTGPMFGSRMRAPVAGSLAAAREAEILAWGELTADDLARGGKLAEGTRRALAIAVDDVSVEVAGDVAGGGAIRVAFTLPAGAYATVVMRELMKVDAAGPGDAASPDADGDADPAGADATDADPADADGPAPPAQP